MKFKAFSNPLLNLGSMDVELASRAHLSLLVCSACGFTSGVTFYSNCDHVFCSDCLMLPFEPYHSQQKVVESNCVLCQCVSRSMRIEVKEPIVVQLECVCPRCRITLRLRELKTHLKSCKILPRPSCALSLNEKSAAKQNADDASVGDHSTSAIANDGDAEQAMSVSGSQQWARRSSVTAEISAVRREVIDMMSNDKNEFRSEFAQKIKAVSNSASSTTTQSQSRQRSFQLALKRNPNSGRVSYTGDVCVDDVRFAVEYSSQRRLMTATVCAIGDTYANSLERAQAPTISRNRSYLNIGNKIQVGVQPHNDGRAYVGSNSSLPLEYVLQASVKFDWTSMLVEITEARLI